MSAASCGYTSCRSCPSRTSIACSGAATSTACGVRIPSCVPSGPHGRCSGTSIPRRTRPTWTSWTPSWPAIASIWISSWRRHCAVCGGPGAWARRRDTPGPSCWSTCRCCASMPRAGAPSWPPRRIWPASCADLSAIGPEDAGRASAGYERSRIGYHTPPFFVTRQRTSVMKTAQEFRAGQVANINGQPWVIQKAEFNKSGRNAAVVKMKLKNLLTGAGTETVFKADDKLEPIILERKEVTYSYFADPLYVFMDSEFNQYEIEKSDLEGVMAFIEDGMTDVCEAVFYNDRVISVELPTTIVRQIAYTEPAVRGDTSGKVMKTARLNNGAELQVSAFCEIGDFIEIDTRTGEYKARVKA